MEYGVVDEVITSRKITPELAAVEGGGLVDGASRATSGLTAAEGA